MPLLSRFTTRAVLALAVTVITAAVAVVGGRASTSDPGRAYPSSAGTRSGPAAAAPALTPHFPLTTVDTDLLNASGVTLSVPAPSSHASLTAADAQARTLQQRPDAQFRELGLARVQFTATNHGIDAVCWVVSVAPRSHAPSDGPEGSIPHAPSARAFDIYVFDAATGAFLFELGGDPSH